MNILQLCCFTDLWHSSHQVESIDLRLGTDIFDYPDKYAGEFDLVCAAPPCDQFTKANNTLWVSYPEHFIRLAEKCFSMCLCSGLFWFMENPPGRIENFIPGLTKYRTCTWHGNVTNKEYVIYSNFIIAVRPVHRYGKQGSCNNYTKMQRERWQPDFILDIESCINKL
jgi:hypothetical protein